ncbi:MAG: pyruvate carboxylase subunit B [Clostridia bacterium]|nr:pyruvate carboxylase subunit B [Clostridia bacterium]
MEIPDITGSDEKLTEARDAGRDGGTVSPAAGKRIRITETALRDAHQSLLATRMSTADMLPVLEMLDEAGFYSLECWGGATFDACLRFLHEDPWERLRTIRTHVKNTKLQMLFRGQNILGYRHYPDEVVEAFAAKSIDNGIDIIRIFDALNDPRNLETSIKAIKKYGGHCQAAISYTTSPVHSNGSFAAYAKVLQEMGADSICIKDMAGLLRPYDAYELVTEIKKAVSLDVTVHTHATAGLASMTQLKAIEAGADVVDCAISPLSQGTSHPSTESLVAALAGTPYDTGLSLSKLGPVAEYFAGLRKKYIAEGLISDKVLGVDVNALRYQVPGGMLSNLVSQLASQGKSDLLPAVLDEVPRVRADAGYPPLVTPSSQIVGTQAVLNVISGSRYKVVTKEFKALLRGEYGRTPARIKSDVLFAVVGDDAVMTENEAVKTESQADSPLSELDRLRGEIEPWYEQEEDVLTYALFENTAKEFFEYRKARRYALDGSHSDPALGVHTV